MVIAESFEAHLIAESFFQRLCYPCELIASYSTFGLKSLTLQNIMRSCISQFNGVDSLLANWSKRGPVLNLSSVPLLEFKRHLFRISILLVSTNKPFPFWRCDCHSADSGSDIIPQITQFAHPVFADIVSALPGVPVLKCSCTLWVKNTVPMKSRQCASVMNVRAGFHTASPS